MNRLEGRQRLDAQLLWGRRPCWHDAARTWSEIRSSCERQSLRLLLTLRSQVVHVASPNRAPNLLWGQDLAGSGLLLLKPLKLVLLSNSLRKSHDVFFARATDVSDCILHYLDATLSIVGNDVPSDVGLAVLPEHDDAIEGTLLDLVPPNQRHRPGLVVVANNLHAVLVRLGYLIVEQF